MNRLKTYSNMSRIHLIRTQGPQHPLGVAPELVDRVAQIINRSEGPLTCEAGPFERLLPDRVETIEEKDIEDVTRVQYCKFSKVSPSLLKLLDLPREVPRTTWDTLFEICDRFRESSGIPDEDYVFVLTDITNEYNWFSALDNRPVSFVLEAAARRNAFIQTSDWDLYVPGAPEYPIAYQVINSILQWQLLKGPEALKERVHQRPRGCFMDFCENKKEVSLKLRTADICPDCLKGLQDRGTPNVLLNQAVQIMNVVREQVHFIRHFELQPEPVSLNIEVYREQCKLFLDWNQGVELKLYPVQKVIYLLHLLHEPGYTRNEFYALKDAFSRLYRKFHHSINQQKTIDDLFDNTQPGKMDTAFSSTRKAIRDQIPTPIVDYYQITEGRGERRNIPLDRGLVRGLEMIEAAVRGR